MFNDVTEKDSTRLYIHEKDDTNNDISSFMETIKSVTSTIKGFVRISNKFDISQFLLFQITALSNDNNNDNYWTLTVNNQAFSHDSPFSGTEDIIVSFITNGNKGDKGEKGAQGYTGYTGFQGFQGYTGYTGFQGFQGYTGYTGFQGFQGNASFDSTTDISVKDLSVAASGKIGSGYSSATPSNGELIVESKVGIGSSDPVYTLDVIGTDAMRIPAGTQEQRPSTTNEGLIR